MHKKPNKKQPFCSPCGQLGCQQVQPCESEDNKENNQGPNTTTDRAVTAVLWFVIENISSEQLADNWIMKTLFFLTKTNLVVQEI